MKTLYLTPSQVTALKEGKIVSVSERGSYILKDNAIYRVAIISPRPKEISKVYLAHPQGRETITLSMRDSLKAIELYHQGKPLEYKTRKGEVYYFYLDTDKEEIRNHSYTGDVSDFRVVNIQLKDEIDRKVQYRMQETPVIEDVRKGGVKLIQEIDF